MKYFTVYSWYVGDTISALFYLAGTWVQYHTKKATNNIDEATNIFSVIKYSHFVISLL